MGDTASTQLGHAAGTTILFHGGAVPTPHDGMFLSTDYDTAAEYGPVSRYAVRLGRVFDSTQPSSIEPLLPMDDPYDGATIKTVDDYMALSGGHLGAHRGSAGRHRRRQHPCDRGRGGQ